MENDLTYDVAIIGGGLAGLAAAIQLGRDGYSVALFEKEKYPFHKVCGEYISMESWNFLETLGLPLSQLRLPLIDTLLLTAPNGKSFTTKLPLGGFGISRYKIDCLLATIAKKNGVTIFEETKAEGATLEDDTFSIQVASKDFKEQSAITAKICCGAFGKRSNLDVKWKRDFLAKNNARENNYLAVKYHVYTSWPENLIGLHNFSDGYCGISRIEDNRSCLCYLTTATNLRRSGNSINKMQETILYKNPALKKIFRDSHFLNDFPVTISQVSFSKKSLVENGVLLLGDAAGMITPLCGNGMSMALHASKIAVACIVSYLQGNSSRNQMEEAYKREWSNLFASRLQTGRVLQRFFGAERLSNFFVFTFKTFPFLSKYVIERTHGQPF